MHTCFSLLRFGLFVFGALGASVALASTAGTALVRHAPSINGTIDGSVQQMLPESVTLSGGAVVTGDLFVPGSPTVRLNGQPNYGGTLEGTGAASPSNYQVTLNGNTLLTHVVRRTNAVALPAVAAPPQPAGTRTVTINSAGQSVGNFATLRHLTLNGGVDQYAIPSGAYGDFTANGGSGFTLGVAGATQPAVYHFQRLTLNGQTHVQILGPVVITVANGFTANGTLGSSAHPSRLALNVYSGGFTLNGGCNVYGYVNAPHGSVIINGNSHLVGGVASDRLILNGGGLLRAQTPEASNQPPLAQNAAFTLAEDATAAIALSATDPDGQPLTYSLLTPPAHGTLTGAPPNLTYTPAANFSGVDTFMFKANDGAADSNTAAVTLNVTPVPDRPSADPKQLVLPEDTPASVVLSGSDADGDALTFTLVTPPAHGTLSGAGSSRTYAPALNYHGPDSFTYVAFDGSLTSAPASVTITVQPQPDRPVALPAAYSVNEGAAVAITLTGTDVDGDPLTFTRLSSPANGTLAGASPNFTYTPNPNFDGIDSFTFRASDGALTSDPATITIRAVDGNYPPEPGAVAVQTEEDTPKTITLSASDRDGDAVAFMIVTPPTKGALGSVILGAGNTATVVYTPNLNVTGSDSFTFKANDGKADTLATASITITPVNDAPIADAQTVGTDEDTPVTLTLTGSDVENSPLTFALVTLPAQGALGPIAPVAGNTATVTYTPAPNANGVITFTFKANDGDRDSVPATVTLNVRPINDAPMAQGGAATTPEDTPLILTLTATDADSATLTFTLATPPTKGTLGPVTPTSSASATVTYTPGQDYHGADSFTFHAHDDATPSATSAPAAVALTVTSVNDAPIAADQNVTFPETEGGTLTLSATDPDGDPLTYTHTQPRHGTLTGASPNLTYTPTANYVGPDSFTFTATDSAPLTSSAATVSITVFDVNTPPTARDQTFALDEDTTHAFTPDVTDADNGALTYTIITPPAHGSLANVPPGPVAGVPSITYQPATNYHGEDSFVYEVRDGSGTPARATVSFTVHPINDAPVGNAQALSLLEDASLALTLGGTDAENNQLTYTLLASPARGTLEGVPPNLTYRPYENVFGDDAFTFKVSDGEFDSSPATIALSIGAVNDAPMASSQTATVDRDGTVTIVLVASDIDGDALQFVAEPPAHGTLTGSAPNFVYRPAPGYHGSDSFAFRVSDGHIEIGPFIVSIEVVVPNLPPVVNAGADQAVRFSETTAGRPRGKILINNDEWTFTEAGFDPSVPDVHASTTTFLKNVTHWITGGRPGRFLGYANVVPGSVEFTYTRPELAQAMARLGHDWTVSFAPTLTLEEMQKYDGVFLAANLVDNQALIAYVAGGGSVYISSGTRWMGDIPNEGVLWWGTFLNHFGLGYAVGYNGVTGFIPVPPSDHPLLQGVERLFNGNGNSVVVLNASNPDTELVWSDPGAAPLLASYGGENTNHFFLVGSATDDSPPPAGLAYQWSLVEGPGPVEIDTPTRPTTRARFSAKGTHRFRLTVSDGSSTGFDEVVVMVHDAPTVYAGEDLHVLDTADSVTLIGTANDDGLPQSLTYQWTSVGGPGAVALGAPTSSTSAAAFSAPGIYTLKLATSDGMFTAEDFLEVRVASVSAVRPSGLIAWWPGNFAPDEVISGRHALPGRGMDYRSGKVAGAFSFDGIDDYFRVRAHGALDLGAQNAFAVEFWLKPELDRTQTVLEWVNLSGMRGLAVTTSVFSGSRRIGIELTDKTGARHDAHVENFYELGVWQHVAFSYEKATGRLRVYKNGQLRADQSLGVFEPQTSYDLFVGGRMPRLGGSFFQGQLDELSFYTRALRPSEVYEIFAEDSTGKKSMSANTTPIVSAGANQAVRAPEQVATLTGTAQDDGQPFGGALFPSWKQVSGPGAAIFGSPASLATSVTCPTPGIYVFELNVSDGASAARDTVEVRVGTLYSETAPSDLVAWWPGNDASDDVASGLDGMWFNGPSYTAGKVGRAFGFDGNHKVQVDASPNFNPAAWDGLSVEFWVRPTGMENSSGTNWLQWRNPAGATGVTFGMFYFFGWRFEVDLKDTTGQSHAFHIDHAVAMDAWQHFLLSYDRTTGAARVYRNGALAYENNLGIFVPQLGYDLLWGNISDDKFRGALDEIAIYRRALNSEEAYQLYAGAFGKSPLSGNQAPTVAAGLDILLRTAGETAVLLGTVTDDGLPSNNTVATRWSIVSGPGMVNFADPTQKQTTATFAASGVYVLKLSADDGLNSVSDTVTVKVGPSVTSTLSTDAVAWWPGNDDARDIVGGRDGQWVNGAEYAAGKVGGAFRFDGARKVRVPAVAALDASTWSGLTLEFWLRPSGMAVTNGSWPFLQWRNAAGTTGVSAGVGYFFGWQFDVNLKDTAGQSHSFRTEGVAQDVWQHMVVTYERASGRAVVYRDGILVFSTTLGSFTPDTRYDVEWGNPMDSGFRGSLDELTLYRRALSADEVGRIFAAASGKVLPAENTPPTVNAGVDVLAPTAPATATLHGSVSDDQKPFGPPTLSWTQLSGPSGATVEFANAAAAVTTATFSANGRYQLQLTATDSYSAPVSDVVNVRVGASTVPPPTDIAAWWPADAHPREVVRGGHDVVLNGAVGYATAKVNQGFSFAGNGGAHVPGQSDLDLGSSAAGFTIEFWVKRAQLGDGPLLMWKNGGANGVYIYTNNNGQNAYIDLVDTAGTSHVVEPSASLVLLNEWAHLAFTYDRPAGRVRLYGNGRLLREVQVGSFAVRTDPSYALWIASEFSQTSFRGLIDELSLYHRPLSATEVLAIHAAGSDGKSAPGQNLAPIVSAGPDVALASVAQPATLQGSVADPDQGPFGAPTVLWSVASQPASGTVQFDNVLSPITHATFTSPGAYLLKLTGSDRFAAPVSDLVEVRVGLSPTPTASGIAAWWPGNGDGREVVNGRAPVDVLNGASYVDTPTLQGFALNGVNGLVRAPGHDDLDIGASTAGLTIELWVKRENLVDGPIFAWHSGSVYGMYVWTSNNGQTPYWDLVDTTGTGHVVGLPGAPLALGQWVHLAFAYDRPAGIARAYVNGSLVREQSVGVFTPRTGSAFSFWLGSYPSDRTFKGVVDEPALYRRPLSATEIAAIFAAGAAGKVLPQPNTAPVANAGADTIAVLGVPVELVGTATDDGQPNPPATLTYAWSKVSGPGEVSFSAPTAATTTAAFATAGSYVLRLSVSDSELTGADEITVTASAAPTIAFTEPLDGATLAAATPFDLVVRATDLDGTIAKVEFFQGAIKLGQQTAPLSTDPTSYFWSFPAGLQSGSYSFTAKATDNHGLGATSSTLHLTVIADPGAPFVEISTPDEDARITQPTEVRGAVSGALLASWKLERRLKAAEGAAAETWTAFAGGNSAVGAQGAPAVLGTFDPTSLLNGIYELRLVATDTSGRTATDGPFTVLVEGNMKIGAFSLAFEDLKVPVAGIPITITRTYDSRDSRIGDFGPGWRMALNNIRVQKNRHLGRGWFQTLQSGDGLQFYYVDPVGDRVVTVIMPDGETHRFRGGALVKNRPGDPDNASFGVVAREGRYKFYPMGDTTSSLEPLDSVNQLYDRIWLEGTGDQDLNAGEYGDLESPLYNATRFRLTTSAGTVFILDEALGLLEMRDLNGNTLVLNRDAHNRVISVVSTPAPSPLLPAPTMIEIHRDESGRVDYIRDPAGRDLDYLYDATGRLASFVDRENNTTQFRYENATFPYYLTKIIDPRGVAALRSEYDPVTGKLIKQIDADGKETVFNRGVDATGRFEKVKDRLGHETTFYYDERGNVTLKIDPLGAQTSYTYYPDSDRAKFETDHYGNVKSFAYDARGNVLVQTLGANTSEDPANPTTGYTTRTTYNANSAPTQMTDPDGRVQSFTYHATTNNLLTHMTGVGGAAPTTTTYAYNADGTLDTITDALGNVTKHAYNYAFSEAAYPGAVKQTTVAVTDPAGAAGSDAANVTATVLRSTRTISDSQENQLAQIVTRTLPGGSTEDVVTRYLYDAENRLRATVMPDGRVTETRYTAFGKEEKSVLWRSLADYQSGNDTLARITSYGYDARGNQTSVTHPDNTTDQTSFDLENRKAWSQDRRGYRTFFVYDAVGRLLETIHPDADDLSDTGVPPPGSSDPRLVNNPRTKTQYDLIGRVRFQTDERGAKTESTYEDGCGCAMRRKQMIQHRTAGNLVTHYQYDNAGNVRFVADPRGNTTETRYDAQGRPTRVIHPATDEHPATETKTDYDLLGRRIAVTDQEGKITRYRYDALGRLVEVRQYLDQSLAASDANFQRPSSIAGVASTRYTYDEMGAQTSQIDAHDRATRYETDALGRRTKRIFPKDAAEATALTETLEYDAWGNLWKRTDFAGKTTTFAYDALNRLKSKAADATHPSLGYSHAIARIEYDYDANGARIAARTFNAGNVQLYAETTPRDERGRLQSKSVVGGPLSVVQLSYGYYANNLLKDVVSSNSGGVNVGYRYDELNRLQSVDDLSTGLPTRTTSYGYNPNGSLETLTQSNGVVHAYSYDSLNRLRTLSLSKGGILLHSYEYKLRASGHRRQVIEGARTITYTYDELYRLRGESRVADPNGNNGAIGYDLDKVGNRLSRLSSLPPVDNQTNTFNSRDWLNSDTYNANGSTTVGQVSDLLLRGTDAYDFEERLIVRTKPDGTTINISYDADGHRVGKNILSPSTQLQSSTSWLVDTNNLTGYAQVFEERINVGANTTTRVYTYGTGLISQAVKSASTSTFSFNYYAHDGHSSVRELTNAIGTVTDRYDYDAFGNLVHQTGATANMYRYCSEQYDPDLGLHYNRARYLNTDSGRFWSMDTYEGAPGDPASLHKYLYAQSNPVLFLDPSGHQSIAGSFALLTTVQTLAKMIVVAAVAHVVTKAVVVNFDQLSEDAKAIAREIAQRMRRSSCSAIIGETWERVLWARKRKYPLAEVLPKLDGIDRSLWMPINHAWIRKLMARGCVIIDIQYDPDRFLDPLAQRGIFYTMEVGWTQGYWNKVIDPTIPGSAHLP